MPSNYAFSSVQLNISATVPFGSCKSFVTDCLSSVNLVYTALNLSDQLASFGGEHIDPNDSTGALTSMIVYSTLGNLIS